MDAGVSVVDFYNQINLLYGAITEFCSPQSCPEMKATDEWVMMLRGEFSSIDHGHVTDSNTSGRTTKTSNGPPRWRPRHTSNSS